MEGIHYEEKNIFAMIAQMKSILYLPRSKLLLLAANICSSRILARVGDAKIAESNSMSVSFCRSVLIPASIAEHLVRF